MSDRQHRVAFASAMLEGMNLLKLEGVTLEKIKMPMWLWPWILCLPDPLFRVVSRTSKPISPEAKSSMLQDLERGRRTEAKYLCGEMVALASRLRAKGHDPSVRINAALVDLIEKEEAAIQFSSGQVQQFD